MNHNTPIHLVFFGTHTFAAAIFKALMADSSMAVDCVITQPDRPVGRKQALAIGPVKLLAEQHDIRVEQPESLKNYQLLTTNYQLNIVAQYGRLIPKHIVNAPAYGTLNVHTSLLPKYRGASPIQSAIMNGETDTGVTIMKMDEGLDTGPILTQQKVAIGPHDTYTEIEQKLANVGQKLLLETIPQYLSGKCTLQLQDESQASSCKQLTRDDGKIDWQRSAFEIYNQYRGLTPWPGVWTTWNGRRLKLLQIKNLPLLVGEGHGVRYGTIICKDQKILIQTGHGQLEIFELQLEGKKPMTAAAFLAGHDDFTHEHLN